MENDFDNRIKNQNPEVVSHRIRWSALIIWPALVITIVVFILSMKPFKLNESGIICIPPKDKTAVIKSAIDTYLLNTNEYPATLNDLITDPGLVGWTGPYLYSNQLIDEFGNPFMYIPNSNGKYRLISYGADGESGGEDDNTDTIND